MRIREFVRVASVTVFSSAGDYDSFVLRLCRFQPISWIEPKSIVLVPGGLHLIRFRLIVVRLCVAAFLGGSVSAQISGGVFRGEVRDPSDALVPQTRIVVQSRDNGM